MILCINGLRSSKLFGEDYNQREYINIIGDIVLHLVNNPKIEEVIIGMRTGIDLLVGLAVIKFNKDFGKRIQLQCVIPCSNQTQYYHEDEIKIYNEILESADTVVIMTHKLCDPNVLKKCNRFIIDNSDELLSYWDGQKFKSNSFDMIRYAVSTCTLVNIINPFNLNMRYEY